MQLTTKTNTAQQIINTLRPWLGLSAEEPLQAWGPVSANQCDSAGMIIQKYVTLLVRRQNGGWMLVRQVTNICNGMSRLCPPVVLSTSEKEALRWMAENDLKLEVAA